MKDLQFDIITREIVMVNNDFATTKNPSIQNGGILLYSKGANPLLPLFGIGLIPEVIEGNAKVLTYEMNRWKFQAVQDGATLAQWSAIPGARNTNTEIDISYI
jgi:hypothetical protein